MQFFKIAKLRGKLGDVAIGTIENRIREGVFPPAILLGHLRVWPDIEVDAIMAAIGAGYDDEQLRTLTHQLVASRPVRASKAIADVISTGGH